jgi:TolB-like protein
MRNNKLDVLSAFLSILMAVLLAGCIAGCSGVQTKDSPPMTIAVFDIEDLSSGASGQPGLGQLMSAEIIGEIGKKSGISVVEREKMLSVLEEMNLGSSALADESTRLRVGRMLGARRMIFGGYMIVGSAMRLDLRMVEVETGKIVKTATKTISTDNVDDYLKAAAETGTMLVQDKY